MTHVLLILLGCLLILLTRKIYYRNFEAFLCLLVTVNFDFFHLVPRIGEFDLYKESLLVVVLFYLFEEFFFKRTGSKIADKKIGYGKYGKFVFSYLVILVFGIIVAYSHGQSLVLGIKAFKYYPLILTYFLVIKRGLDIEKFSRYFIALALVLATLAFAQYLLFNSISIFYFYENSITHVRSLDTARGLRLLMGDTVITIATVMSFVLWLKKGQKWFLLSTLYLLAEIILVIQTRSVLVAIAITMVVSFLVVSNRKNGGQLKALLILGAFIVISMVMIVVNYDRIIEHALFLQTVSDIQGVTLGQGTGNLLIRILCYQYYWGEFQSFLFTGRGLLNITWSGNPDSSVQELFSYYLSDIGAFHMLVNFGLLGASLLLLLIVNVLRDMPVVIRYIPEIACYFVLGLIVLPQIDLFFRLDHIFIFSIFIAALQLSMTCPELSSVLTNSRYKSFTRL